MTATIHAFAPAPDAQAHVGGPLRGLPMRGARPTLELIPNAGAGDEAVLASQLLLACAPGRPDKLEAAPAVKMRQGEPTQPLVIVDDRGLMIIASADAMRRIAVLIDGSGRQGAALDLMQAADQAEALASHLQRGAN